MTGCRWCDGVVPPSKSPNRLFCSDACRADYHSACRRFTETLIADGAVSVETVRALTRKRQQSNPITEAVNGDVGGRLKSHATQEA